MALAGVVVALLIEAALVAGVAYYSVAAGKIDHYLSMVSSLDTAVVENPYQMDKKIAADPFRENRWEEEVVVELLPQLERRILVVALCCCNCLSCPYSESIYP